jgi:hypothetical protein
MPTPLELAVTQAVTEQLKLTTQISEMQQDLRAAQNENAILLGKIKQLEAELTECKISNDNNLQWAAEVTSQLHSVGMFVSDALNTARVRVQDHRKGNGTGELDKAYAAVEKALLPGTVQSDGTS